MSDFVLLLGAISAAIGWLFQKAWDRRELRIQRYQEIVDLLPAFMVGHQNREMLDKAYKEIRRLWLFAPDDVVDAAIEFANSTASGNPTTDIDLAMKKFILAMRKDSTLFSALWPRLHSSKVGQHDFNVITPKKEIL